jgi:alpha-glucosidase (family GH31 glycosyl hydrolase)
VWDDRGDDTDFRADDGNAHRAAAVLDLVDGYQRRGIPVGTVLLDSPWSTNYNTFRFDPRRYPDPAGLVNTLHARGVRVVAWLTAAMNPAYRPFSDEDDYLQGISHRCLLRAPDGSNIPWWKGAGGLIDYSSPWAVDWWHHLMDRALDMGLDGWKVDKVEASLPEEVDQGGVTEPAHVSAYRQAYFKDTYQYLLRRRPDGVVIQRPFYRNTIAYTPAGWVGDQPHSWTGLRSALRLVMGAAKCGNAVIGSDIGGYLGGKRPNKNLYLRWAQFGALCPLMETGGQGERRPWKIDEETVGIFRRFATLHAELVPYLYSQMVQAHLTGVPIIRAIDRERGEYLLGPDLFVSAVMHPGVTKDVHLPAGEWIDFWDETRIYRGSALVRGYEAPLNQMPLFIRRGALVPLDVSTDLLHHGDASSAGALTLALYPGDDPEPVSSCDYAYETGPRDYALTAVQAAVNASTVSLTVPPLPQAVRVRVRLTSRPGAVLAPDPLPEVPDRAAFQAAARGWCWERGLLWVKLPPAG